MQTIAQLFKSVSSLVESRDIIDHGSIRMLHSERAIEEIAEAEGIDEDDVCTDTIGDDTLSERLAELAESDEIGNLYLEDLVKLEEAYRGDDINDYIDSDSEDELFLLDELIEAAQELA